MPAENEHPFEVSPKRFRITREGWCTRRRISRGFRSIEAHHPHSGRERAVGAARRMIAARKWKPTAGVWHRPSTHPKERRRKHPRPLWSARRRRNGALVLVSGSARERFALRCLPLVVMMQAAQRSRLTASQEYLCSVPRHRLPRGPAMPSM